MPLEHEDELLDLEAEDTEGLGMDEGMLNDLEIHSGHGVDEDGKPGEDDISMPFYYDPGLDSGASLPVQKHLPDLEVPVSISRPGSAQVPPHNLLPTDTNITPLTRSPEASSEHIQPPAMTSQATTVTISEQPANTAAAVVAQADSDAPSPSLLHGPSLFTGPLVSLPSFTQFSKMSQDDCWEYVRQLHTQSQALMTTVNAQATELESANAHCTMARHEISTLRDQQANKKKGKGRTMKIASRWISHPDLKGAFESQRKEEEEKAAKEAEIAAKKKRLRMKLRHSESIVTLF